MNAALILVRAVHFGSAMLLFGELLFTLTVAGSLWRPAQRAGRPAERRSRAVVASSIAVSVASGVLWLVFEASDMTGEPVGQAIGGVALPRVLTMTEFGHVWLLRTVLLALVGITIFARRRSAHDEAATTRTTLALVAAAAYLAALAWAGHAGAAEESVRPLHLGSDMLHLLAAGAWLGALPALVACLRSTRPGDAVARVTLRFSMLGVISVGALLFSGIVNACLLVGSVPALFGTTYGRLLLAKVAIFIGMLGIAAFNRWRLTPRLSEPGGDARRSLRRNAMIEIASGILVLAIVGALGTTVPGVHQAPVWPFSFTLDFNLERLHEIRGALVMTGALAVIGLFAGVTGARRRRLRWWAPGVVALALSVAASARLLAAPAYPTSYAASPVPYDVAAVAHGTARFAQACSSCHGAAGRGDGPAAAALPVPPADLVAHFPHHREGDMFWWIAHGLPGTPMPAFSPPFSDTQVWEVVQFLHARASAAAAATLGEHVDAAPVALVPDFTFERPVEGQQTLYRRRAPTLIVLYTLPSSKGRLDALAAMSHTLMHAGLQVLAVPLAATSDADTHAAKPALAVVTSPDVPATYEWFARRPGDAQGTGHAELLVDRSGYLRARWIGIPKASNEQSAAILAQAERLMHEKERAPPSATHHMH